VWDLLDLEILVSSSNAVLKASSVIDCFRLVLGMAFTVIVFEIKTMCNIKECTYYKAYNSLSIFKI
jgi:hypothetical protein